MDTVELLRPDMAEERLRFAVYLVSNQGNTRQSPLDYLPGNLFRSRDRPFLWSEFLHVAGLYTLLPHYVVQVHLPFS